MPVIAAVVPVTYATPLAKAIFGVLVTLTPCQFIILLFVVLDGEYILIVICPNEQLFDKRIVVSPAELSDKYPLASFDLFIA